MAADEKVELLKEIRDILAEQTRMVESQIRRNTLAMRVMLVAVGVGSLSWSLPRGYVESAFRRAWVE